MDDNFKPSASHSSGLIVALDGGFAEDIQFVMYIKVFKHEGRHSLLLGVFEVISIPRTVSSTTDKLPLNQLCVFLFSRQF